ncbi:MAG: hypothetical protein SGARI_002693, partial [Bacillariaceae sp.]
MPIRDLAAAWDATKLIQYWRIVDGPASDDSMTSELQQLGDAVLDTLKSYNLCEIDDDGEKHMTKLDPTILKEPSNIAHSALYLLAACGAIRSSLIDHNFPEDSIIRDALDGLVAGILSMQQTDGAFLPEFEASDNDVFRGIEFFPGEAMVALMDVY